MSTDPGQLCSLKTLLKNIATQTVKSFFIEFASLYQKSVYQSLKSKQKPTSSTKLLQNYRCRIKFHSDSLGFAFLTLHTFFHCFIPPLHKYHSIRGCFLWTCKIFCPELCNCWWVLNHWPLNNRASMLPLLYRGTPLSQCTANVYRGYGVFVGFPCNIYGKGL